MTRLTVNFPDPGPVTLTTAPGLSLAFPAPQAVTLQVQGIQGPAGTGGGGGGSTNLAWDAATRTISSDTGTDAVITLADGTNAGLMSSASFIALGTALQPGAIIPWTNVSGKPTFATVATSGSAADLTGILPAASFNDTTHGNRGGGSLHANVIAGGAAGFMTGADKTKLDGIAAGAQVNVPTDLSYTAATRILASSTGADVTLPLVVAAGDAGLMTGADKTKLDGIAAGAQVNVPTDLSYTASTRLLASSTGADVTLPLATTTDPGLAPARSGVATQYLDGTGAYSTPAGGGATDLGYTASTRLLTSSTGADVTLPLVTSADAGLAPASGGGTTNFLRADGTWAAPPGGGGSLTVQDEGSTLSTAVTTINFTGAGVTATGTTTVTVNVPSGSGSPGGTNGEVQFNNAGSFAGAADVEIEGGQLRLPAIAIPATPAAGGLKMFARNIGGRILPSTMGPSGLDSPLLPHVGLNKVAWAIPNGNSTTIGQVGLALSAAGTATAKNWASTNRYTKMRGLEYLVTTAATTAIAGWRGAAQQFTVGSNAAEDGGFHHICRWGPSTGVATTTSRAFVGFIAATAAPTDIENSTRTNIVGMGWDAADTNIQIMHNDGTGTATKIDLGASFPVPTVDREEIYELAMFSPPGTTQSVTYRVRNLRTGAEATGTITTDLPGTTTALNPYGIMSVGGTSSVIGICLFSLYIETDY